MAVLDDSCGECVRTYRVRKKEKEGMTVMKRGQSDQQP